VRTTATGREFPDPWAPSIEERIRTVSTPGAHKVAYLYEVPDTSTFRYRVFNMVEALAAQPDLDISAAWFTLDEAGHDLSFIDRAHAVVICRTRYDNVVARIVARAHARATPVIFDVDDLIFDSDYTHLITETLDVNVRGNEDWDYWFAYIARLGATLRACDAAARASDSCAEASRTWSRVTAD